MNKKFIGFVVFLLVFGAFLSSAALAEENTFVAIPLTPDTTVSAPPVEMIPASINSERKLQNLITRANNLINLRVASLNALRTKVENSKLTGEQKSGLFGEINTQTNKLNELYNKIKISKDIKAARAMVKTIYTDFRIYAVFIPKVNSLMALHTLSNHLARFTTLLVEVQVKVDALKAKGVNVDARQEWLDKAKAIVPQIQTKINDTVKTLNALKPADYPGSKNTFASVRASTKELRSMFFNIRKLLTSTKLAK